ncbi:MAG TPA: GTP-binding protein [Actinocrinis sp.]|nr:GTP-binding protein [Actinocrinis sp.]
MPRELPQAAPRGRGALRVGVGGPVGSGKTTLIAGLCSALRAELSLAVVLNDPDMRADTDLLLRQGFLEPDRIAAVRTGCAPQAAIRDDIRANADAAEALEASLAPDLLLIESGGTDLGATFSRGLIDRSVFVLDVAAGDHTPRKAGPGVVNADLLVVNKTDLAGLAHADLDVMRRDAAARRGDAPTVFVSLAEHPGAPAVADWIRKLLAERRLISAAMTPSGSTGSTTGPGGEAAGS